MIRSFDVGAVIGSTFSTYFSNIVPFCTIGLLINVPVIAFAYLFEMGLLLEILPTGDPVTTLGGALAILFILAMVQFVLGFLVTGAISFGVFQSLRGQKPSIGPCISRGFSVLLPVIGVALLVGLLLISGVVLSVGVGILLDYPFVGGVFFIVPVIIFYIMFCIAVPVAVVEKPGVIKSLQRSLDLTSGNRWAVFAVLLVLGILSVFMSILLSVVLAIPISIVGVSGLFGTVIAQSLISVIIGGIWSTALVVIYYHLRSSKESIDVEEIAQVFD